jgi:hypothetical protein
MKVLRVLLILSLCLTAAGCANLGKSMDGVAYDYNVTTDFSRILHASKLQWSASFRLKESNIPAMIPIF